MQPEWLGLLKTLVCFHYIAHAVVFNILGDKLGKLHLLGEHRTIKYAYGYNVSHWIDNKVRESRLFRD